MNIKYYLLLITFSVIHNSYAGPALTLCLDGDCKSSQRVSIADNEWDIIKNIFLQAAESPQQERELITKALPLLKKSSLDILATKTVDKLSANDLHNKMNSRDLALNCKTYIVLLLDQGLIQHHVIRKTEKRSSWTGINEYSAIIQERKNGDLYSVYTNQDDISADAVISSLKQWKEKKSYIRLSNKVIDNLTPSKTKFKTHVK